MVDRVDAVHEAQESFKALFRRRNWTLGAPIFTGTIIMLTIVLGVLFVTLGPSIFRLLQELRTGNDVMNAMPFFAVGKFLIAWSVAMMTGLAISAFTYGWTIAAAEPVCRGENAALELGFSRAAAKIGQLWLFAILVFLLAALTIITIIGPLVILILTLYGPAFILLGNQSAATAIGSSFRLASANLGETAVLALAIFAVNLLFGLAGMVLSVIPILGSVAGLAGQCLGGAYGALATVRFYGLLTKQTLPHSLIPKTMQPGHVASSD